MNCNFKSVALATALVFSASQASAATQLGEYVTFSGFGTLGLTQTSDDRVQFARDRQIPGATNSIDYNVDSNLGAQLTAAPTKWLSGTVQMLAMHRNVANISTEIEWAFVKAEPIKGLSIRAGRMALPMFAISDFRNVGYANTWVRPPDEVYGLALLRRLEGADATYRLPIGSTSLSLSVLGGKSSFYSSTTNLLTHLDKVKGANLQWESDWVTVRVGRVKGIVDLSASTTGLKEDPYTFSGIGAMVDHNNIVAQAEYVTRRSENNPTRIDANGWYVLGGYRFNAVLPYVSYASTRPVDSTPIFHYSGKQTTLAAGVRWDAFKSAAIKFQIQRVDAHDTTGLSFVLQGTTVGRTTTYVPVTSPVNVASLNLDFVF